jgi:hypothetical protein
LKAQWLLTSMLEVFYAKHYPLGGWV